MYTDQREVMSLEKYKLTAMEKLRRSAVFTALMAVPLCIMLCLVFALLASFAEATYHIATVVILTSAVILLFSFTVGGILKALSDIKRGDFYMVEDTLEYVNNERDESLTKRLLSEKYSRSMIVLGFEGLGEMKLDENFTDFPERWQDESFYVIIRKRTGKVLTLYKKDAYRWQGDTGISEIISGKGK